ncbi:hypothetical protein FOA52_009840 [Chlamydomonas sp. UWO 241]|nr:hypothetical protein FOA52_009840 [Chlamydomonas sp. UWO 241]
MSMTMRSATIRAPATSSRSSLVPARPAAVRSVVVRAVDSPESSKETASTSEPAVAAAPSGAAPSVQSFAILNPVTEAINGRAAMLGFVAAVASEAVTHQAVWSQIVGRYINLELVESPIGAAPLGFAAVVALTTMASLAPKMLAGDNVDSKSFGPFTPGLELTLGRVAQMGFLGLVVVELFKGSALLFVLSIPVARGANWFLAGGGRRMDEEQATAAAAERIAAAAEDGTSLPVRLATDVVRFLYGGTGRRGPADGGVVSASLLNAKPAVGGMGVEPRGGGVLRVLFTVASDAVADTVVRWRHELRRCVASTAVFDVLSDREEAQHQALWPAFLAAKVAGKRAQFHRARLVVDGERVPAPAC